MEYPYILALSGNKSEICNVAQQTDSLLTTFQTAWFNWKYTEQSWQWGGCLVELCSFSLHTNICIIGVNILRKSMTRFGKSLNLITIIRKNTLPTDQINIFKTVVVLYIHTTIKLIDMFILSLFKPNGGQEI